MSEAVYRTQFILKFFYNRSEQIYQVRRGFVVRVAMTGTQKKDKAIKQRKFTAVLYKCDIRLGCLQSAHVIG
jgi:hypothetical protein